MCVGYILIEIPFGVERQYELSTEKEFDHQHPGKYKDPFLKLVLMQEVC